MKKFLRLIIFLGLIVLPVKIHAAGSVTVSPSSLTIEEGKTSSFKITAYNVVGDVKISSSNSSVASISTDSWETGIIGEGQTVSATVTVTGKTPGTATISVVVSAATFDEEDVSGTRTVNVTVTQKQTSSGGNTGGSSGTYTPVIDTRSSNNKLKSISVDGYTLEKVDNNNYKLSVTTNITSININAEKEDSKASISGTGKHDLVIGENNIEVVITAENGSQNKISIKVTRKDAYYIEDLDVALTSSKDSEVNIKISSDEKISSKDLNTIKNSAKVIKLNYYDDTNKLVYSYILDGAQMTDFTIFETSILASSDVQKEIAKLSNYADGYYVFLSQKENMPAGTKFVISLSDKYSNDDVLNVYYYNKEEQKMELVLSGTNLSDGYIEFPIEKCSNYLITMSTIKDAEVTTVKSNNSNIMIIVLYIIIVILTGIIIFMVIRKNKKSIISKKIENLAEKDKDSLKI